MALQQGPRFLLSSSPNPQLAFPMGISPKNKPTHVAATFSLGDRKFGLGLNLGVCEKSITIGTLVLAKGSSKLDVGFDLEEEVFEFMKNSGKPNQFPKKSELIAAGRIDLVDSIVKEGGWMVAGWDAEEGESLKMEDDSGILVNGYIGHVNNSRLEPCTDSKVDVEAWEFSGSSMTAPLDRFSGGETDEDNNGGVEGILSRLERERSAFYAGGSGQKEVYDEEKETSYSWRSLTKTYGGRIKQSPVAESKNGKGQESASSSLTESCLNGTRVGYPIDDSSDYGHLAREASTSQWNEHLDAESRDSNGESEVADAYMVGGELISKTTVQAQIHHLKKELSSVLHSVRSSDSAHYVKQSSGKPSKKLQELSDAWEFQETEILKSREKLRATRAKLAILEGKMALEIMEAKHVIEEKQRKIEEAQRILSMLRTACIVWPNSGNEVFLSGSFDGWTAKHRMEKTSSGSFMLNMKLYPGRYETKFIVDGVWRTDPLRQVVYNNGHENNLLIVS